MTRKAVVRKAAMREAMQQSTYQFAPQPQEQDFEELAGYIMKSHPEKLHPALWPQRHQVVNVLRRLSQAPEEQVARSRYHALRLFVW
jgi:hypothetical protein